MNECCCFLLRKPTIEKTLYYLHEILLSLLLKSEGTDVFLTKSSYKSRDSHMPKTLDKSKRKVIMAICVHWIVLVALVAWGAINVSERVND